MIERYWRIRAASLAVCGLIGIATARAMHAVDAWWAWIVIPAAALVAVLIVTAVTRWMVNG